MLLVVAELNIKKQKKRLNRIDTMRRPDHPHKATAKESSRTQPCCACVVGGPPSSSVRCYANRFRIDQKM